MSSIEAIYEDGVFRPIEPVDLPQHCEVELQFRVRATNGNAAGEPLAAATATPIEERLAELATGPTSEEWEQLPTDLSEQLDHYIYGTPRP